MKIAFLEVRDKTRLFAATSSELREHVDVAWLVQNHAFGRDLDGDVFRVPYPRTGARKKTAPDYEAISARVAASDRSVINHGRLPDYYSPYIEEIERWLDRVRPDAIFGEVGNFFSHLTCLLAENRGIPFYNPSSCRYPTGRFSFYRSDIFLPEGGRGSDFSEDEVNATISSIREGRRQPDYMRVERNWERTARHKGSILREYIRGERFITQSPADFLSNRRGRRSVLTSWNEQALDTSAIRDISSNNFLILYPMQMQPEFNLDVWGRPHRDQTALVRKLADIAHNLGAVLAVKPNPKPGLEMSPELMDAIETDPATVAVRSDVKMSDIAHQCDLAVTVTGTVAIERIVSRLPVIVLGEEYRRFLGLPESQGLPAIIGLVDELTQHGDSTLFTDQFAHLIIRRLADTSYRGIISEPTLAPYALESENVRAIAAAFIDLLGSVVAPDK